MHTCDDPRCVNVDHLVPGTQTMNLADMRRKGRGVVAAEEAREEAEIRASIEADLEAARAANAPALIEETTAKVVPVDETATEEQDEEAPY